MGAALLAILAPTAAFGLLALLALRFGAETRPGFDEKPVLDDRPNWPAIACRPPVHRDDPEPRGGEPAAARPVPRRAAARPAPLPTTPRSPAPRPARGAA
jgi:hypothetical protein